MKTVIIIFFVLCLNNFVFSQVSEGGIPISFLDKALFEDNKGSIPAIELPYLDNEYESIRASEYQSENCADCENNYYGKGGELVVNIIDSVAQVTFH